MSTIAQLCKPAAKLLLLFLETDGESLPLAQAMAEAGVTRSDYYRGKSQLQKLGFIDRRGNLTWRPTASKPEAVEDGGLAHTPEDRPEVLPSIEPQTMRQRAMQADLMDDAGDWNSSNSPRRKRRLAQIKVVQDAWDEAFNETLTPENAKDFLGWNDDSAEAVLDIIEDAKRRVATGYVKSPLAWLRSKFIKRAKEAPAAPQVKQASIGPVEESSYMEPSPEYLAQQAKIKRLMAKRKARGDNDGWDDE